MKYGIYSIRDSAAGVFTAPTIDITDESAIRGFSQAVNNAGSVMNFCPYDFILYRIGTLNVEAGTIDPISPPTMLVSGERLVKVVTQNEDRTGFSDAV